MRKEIAEVYTAADIDVFPIKVNSKTPAISGWQKAATTKPKKHWFPKHNIGVLCGDGLLVVDIDMKDGKDGALALYRLEDEHAPLPETLTIETPSGGSHEYYFYDGEEHEIPTSHSKYADGVDFQADGAYVVGAGSVTADGGYTVSVDAPIATAPVWLLGLLARQEGDNEVDAGAFQAGDLDEFTPRDRDALFSLKSDDRGVWCNVAAAMRYTFGAAALPVFIEWSMASDKFASAADCEKTFNSFKSKRGAKDCIKWPSIMKMAHDADWKYDIEPARSKLAEKLNVKRKLAQVDADVPRETIDDLPAIGEGTWPDTRLTTSGLVASVQPVTKRNVAYALEVLGITARFNLLTKADELTFDDEDMVAEGDYTIDALLWGAAQMAGMTKRAEFEGYVSELAGMSKYHPVGDWMAGLEPDNKDWIATLLSTVDLDENQEAGLWRSYLTRWLISVCQAVCGWERPQQIRGVLCFSGPQSCGKTTWFESICPQGAYIEGCALSQHGGAISPDSIRIATSGVVCELGEIETTFSRSDASALKNFVTSTHDRYRLPWGRRVVSYVRTTVFCGTVNRLDFLRDASGSTRFWPVAITRARAFHDIPLEGLWAQVYAMWKAGEAWQLTKKEEGARHSAANLFEERSGVQESVDKIFEDFGEIDKKKWVAVTASEMLKAFDTPNATRPQVSAMTDALTKTTGKQRGKAKGRRWAWLVPPAPRILSVVGKIVEKPTLRVVK